MRKRMISAVVMFAVLVASALAVKYDVKASTTGASGFALELEEENPKTLVKGENYTLKISPSGTVTNNNIYFVLKYDYDVIKIDSNIVVEKGWSQFIKIEVDEVVVQLSGDASSLVAGEAFIEIPIVVRENVSQTKFALSNVNYDGRTYEPLVLGGGTSAEEEGDKDKSFKMELGNVTAKEEAVIPFHITENTGIHAVGLTITYNPQVCSFDRISVADDFKNKITLQSIYEVPGEGKVGVSFLATDNMEDTGVFANLYLDIKDEVEAGTISDVTVEITQAATQEETIVSGTKVSSSITVTKDTKEDILGDVNEDGKINLLDGMYILRYYNEEISLTNDQLKAADTRADGKVNLLDALQILRYYNGEIAAF